MRVKVFTANTAQEAMAQVKTDMGREAVILHTRRLRKGGLLGFFTHEVVEVTAALDSTAAVTKKVAPVAPVAAASVDSPADCSSGEKAATDEVQSELVAMRKMLEQALHKAPDATKLSSSLLATLLKNDVDPQIAETLVKDLPDPKLTVAGNAPSARQVLEERLAGYFSRVDGITISPAGMKKVALIGPTGVGKTTTIAKLAADFTINKGYKVALVTADTYRISAVEQLKTYADIIGIPVEVVYAADGLRAALDQHRDKDLILLDTAGRSPHNQEQVAELQALLAIDPSIETHLVLSTTTKYKDAVDIVNKFSLCAPRKILFTKLDEAGNAGTILNILCQFSITVSYVTTGQSVPDDIELADSAKLVNLILRDL